MSDEMTFEPRLEYTEKEPQESLRGAFQAEGTASAKVLGPHFERSFIK